VRLRVSSWSAIGQVGYGTIVQFTKEFTVIELTVGSAFNGSYIVSIRMWGSNLVFSSSRWSKKSLIPGTSIH